MFPEPSRDAWFSPPYRQLEPGELAQDGDEANSPHNPADRGWCIIGKEIFLEDGHPAYKHLILRTKRPKPCNDANTVVEPDETVQPSLATTDVPTATALDEKLLLYKNMMEYLTDTIACAQTAMKTLTKLKQLEDESKKTEA
jgi:hypothetical protein